MFQKQKPPQKKADSQESQTQPSARKIPPTIISVDVRILGNVVSDGMVDINGRIEGNVKSQIVYIRKHGVVIGDVVSEGEVHVYGSVHGVIKSPRVSIYEGAHIEGVILHKSLSIEDGAYVDAQFKPFDSQPRLTGEMLEGEAGEITVTDSDKMEDGESYDMLKDLKLVQ